MVMPIALLLSWVLSGVVGADEAATSSPLEPADTSSPRATLESFLNACNDFHRLMEQDQKAIGFSVETQAVVERILDCLELDALPIRLQQPIGIKAAIVLKEVLDRVELPPLEQVSGALEAPDRWQIPHTRIVIARIDRGPRKGAYLFSVESIRDSAGTYILGRDLSYREGGLPTSPGLLERYAKLLKLRPSLSPATSSPRGTLTVFLDSVDELYQRMLEGKVRGRDDTRVAPTIDRILDCLDLSDIPEFYREAYAAEAAVCLKEILDRVPLPLAERIPGPEQVAGIDGGDPLVRWQVPNTQITIARITEGPRKGEYLFSRGTVKRAPQMYHRLKHVPYRSDGRLVSAGLYDRWLGTPGNAAVAAVVNRFPMWVRHRLFSLAIWQWIGLSGATIVALGLMFAAYRQGHARGVEMRRYSLLRYWLTMSFTLAAMAIPLLYKYVASEYLYIRGKPLYLLNFAADFTLLIALIVVILAMTSRLADSVVALSSTQLRGIDVHLIRLLWRVSGVVAAIIVFLEGAQYLGLPITTLLASAGIGGLAIALSAQSMVRGLFGTVMILADKPYSVGERIQIGDVDGIVEEIGVRSTKIRELRSGSLVYIPNDRISDQQVRNIGKRSSIRRTTELRIPLNTPRAKIESALSIIREVLDGHEGMDPERPPRIHLIDLLPDGFRLRILYWYSPPDYWQYCDFCETVNLAIIRAFEEQGVAFSLPSRHTFAGDDNQPLPLEVRVVRDESQAEP